MFQLHRQLQRRPFNNMFTYSYIHSDKNLLATTQIKLQEAINPLVL